MKRFNKGSTLLMVICFTGFLSFAALGVWRTTMYVAQAAHERAIQSQLFTATEGLLNLAIELGIENFDRLINETQELSIQLPAWHTARRITYEGTIHFLGTNESVVVRAQLIDGARAVSALRCALVKDSQGSWAVQAWAIDNPS